MYAGKVVEEGPTASCSSIARHPYTRGLLKSIPRLGERRAGAPLGEIKGMAADLFDAAAGLRFNPRCPEAMPACWASRAAVFDPATAGDTRPLAGSSRRREGARYGASLLEVKDLKVHFPVAPGASSRVSGRWSMRSTS